MHTPLDYRPRPLTAVQDADCRGDVLDIMLATVRQGCYTPEQLRTMLQASSDSVHPPPLLPLVKHGGYKGLGLQASGSLVHLSNVQPLAEHAMCLVADRQASAHNSSGMRAPRGTPDAPRWRSLNA